MGATTIGSALAQRRLELSLEKGQAAKQIGMSRTTYSSYEQDAQRPSTEVFTALAEFLGISVEQFLPLYGATCIAQARVSLGRVAPQSQSSSETSNALQSSVGHEHSELVTTPEVPSPSDPPSTTTEAAKEPAEVEPPEPVEPEIALEVAEVEDTPEPSESDESDPVEATESRTPTAQASRDDLSMSWPSSLGKDAGHKKKKKKKKGKKG
jgi:transcriptional regulator with XRE-family HTH domain